MSMKSIQKNQTKKSGGLASSAELIGMGIKESSCRLERSAYADLRRKDSGQSTLREISSRTSLVKQRDGAFDAQISYELRIKERNIDLVPLKIECVFEAHFHGPKTASSGEAKSFVDDYLGIISWPYFRQYVSDVTARMSIAPIVLPLLPED